jgi:hypothetical protein
MDLPSDLAGITRAEYNDRPELRAALGPVATSIRSAIAEALAKETGLGFVSAGHYAFAELFRSWTELEPGLEGLNEERRRNALRAGSSEQDVQRAMDDYEHLDILIERHGMSLSSVRILLDHARTLTSFINTMRRAR